MKDLKARIDELLAGFRESGYCTDCWTNLHEEPHDGKCPETWMPESWVDFAGDCPEDYVEKT